MIPNGALMNANITNYSSETDRRVDLEFSCARGEDVEKVQSLMLDILKKDPKVMETPEPFARLTGGTENALTFSVRAWCRNEDYWDLYYDLLQKVTGAMTAAGVESPAMRILQD